MSMRQPYLTQPTLRPPGSQPGYRIRTPAGFQRASTRYNDEGTLYSLHQPAFNAGRYGKGVSVMEPVTNLLTANQASVETDTTGFTARLSATLTRVTTEHWHGSASLRVDTPGGDTGEGAFINDVPVTASQPYTFQVRAKGAGSLSMVISEYASGVWVGDTTINFTATGSWQRVVGTRFFGATATTAVLHIRTSSAQAVTFYLDGFQFDNKPYATSWQLPGTARSADALTILTSGVLNGREGAGEAWVNISRAAGTNDQYIFDGGGQANSNLVVYVKTTGAPTVVYGTGTGTVEVNSTSTLTAGTVAHIEWRWTPTGCAILVNGAGKGASTTAPAITFGQTAYVGAKQDGTLQLDGTLDDLVFSDIGRTDAEFLTRKNSGIAATWDTHTTLSAHFDGDLTCERKV